MGRAGAAARDGDPLYFLYENTLQQFILSFHTMYIAYSRVSSVNPLRNRNRNRNRKLLISRAPTKAKSQEPAYSQALNQNKIDRQRSRNSRSRVSDRQTVRRLWWMVFGVETGEVGMGMTMNQDRIC